MRTVRRRAFLAWSVLLLAVGAAATPRPAMASDCGASYVSCLVETTGLDSSDQYHEKDCYADYWRCIGRLLIVY